MVNYQAIAKKYAFDILQERYQSNDSMINRLTHYLTSEQDVKDFCQIIIDCYTKGYVKAVDDYKSELKNLGYNVNLKTTVVNQKEDK